jgi:hypothetical protein
MLLNWSLSAAQIRERVEEWVFQQVELDQHLKEMQFRHRILGYTRSRYPD